MALSSVVEALAAQVQARPDQTALVFVSEDGSAQEITYRQLGQDMERSAAALHAQGFRSGDLLLLAFPHGYALVSALLGAITLGAVPAILPYVDGHTLPDAYRGQVQQTVVDLAPRAILTLPALQPTLQDVLAAARCPVVSRGEDEAEISAFPLPPVLRGGSDPLHLQISSGTTGQPKAVIVTHAALLNYATATAQALAYTEADVTVGWAPLYHDLGLTGQLFRPLLAGARSVLLAPADWIRRPHRLLQAVDRYRGTVTAMPNFAFVRCARQTRDEDIAGVDLASWRVILNGGERVSLAALRLFHERFAPYGLRYQALAPVYGLAENVASAAVTPLDQGPSVDWVAIPDLHHQGRAVPAFPSAPDAQPIVSCGVPIPGTHIAILNEQGRPLGERQVGEIALQGSSLCAGYHRRSDLPFRDAQGWFHTGDIGYLANGQLYVCDRKKDLIIAGGHNIHPANIEAAAQQVIGPMVSVWVAVGVPDERLGTERPVLMGECRHLPDAATQEAWAASVRRQVAQACGLALADVVFVPRGWVVRTTSGKASRVANRQKYVTEYSKRPAQPDDSPDMQAGVMTIFRQVLGVSHLEPTDSFFALGGDSLSALHLILEVEERFGRAVAPHFFTNPTVAGLVAALQSPAETPTPLDAQGGPQGFPGVLLRRQANQKIHPLWRAAQMDVIYPTTTRLLAWLCGQPWAQLLLWRRQRWLIRAFYASLARPVPTQRDVLRLSFLGHVGSKPRIDTLLGATPEQFERYVTLSGEEYLKQALTRGRGVILLGYHSFPETPALIVSTLWRRGYTDLYALTLGDFDSVFEQPVPAGDSPADRGAASQWAEHLVQAQQLLRANYVVLTAADAQGGASAGFALPLHGRQWMVKQGFAELAMKTEAAVLPLTLALTSKGQYAIRLHPPLDVGAPPSRERQMESLMEQCGRFLQTAWAEHPETLLWEVMGAHLLWPPVDRGTLALAPDATHPPRT